MTGSFDEDVLLRAARAAKKRAYAPYSSFRVGCALLAADGKVYLGANVENAAYSPSICAERVALPAAIVDGQRDLVAIAIVGDGQAPCTPCGVCRQVLFEFAPDLQVVCAADDGSVARYVLGRDLLPDGFGPENLGVQR